jgi:hypothetical protein
MTKRLLSICILFSSYAHGQGYALVGSSLYLENKSSLHSINIGAGYDIDHYSAGVLADFYTNNQTLLAALDIRRYIGPAYISVRPGKACYSRTVDGVRVTGKLALGSSIGVRIKFIDFSIGWQYASYEVMKSKSESNSFRINLSLGTIRGQKLK